jgi:UPF0716 family protein affecting phage T7 exclusion
MVFECLFEQCGDGTSCNYLVFVIHLVDYVGLILILLLVEFSSVSGLLLLGLELHTILL